MWQHLCRRMFWRMSSTVRGSKRDGTSVHLHYSESLGSQLFSSVALAFRVALYQVAVLNELLECRWLNLKRLFLFFFCSALMDGSQEPRWSTQMFWNQSEESHVRPHAQVILCEPNWGELISQKLSFPWASTGFECVRQKYLLLHCVRLKIHNATFLLKSEQKCVIFSTLPQSVTTSTLCCSWCNYNLQNAKGFGERS